MSKQSQWVAGINAVASALEHDAEHVREVLLEAGSKNPRIADIENVEIVFKDGVGYDTKKLLAAVKGHYGEY